VVGLGLVAFAIAALGGSVHSLIEESSALGSAGLFVAGLLGLFTRFGGVGAALSSLVVGAGTYVYSRHVLESDVAYLLSLGGAALGYGIGALADARSPALSEATLALQREAGPPLPHGSPVALPHEETYE
jgi:hypothetical protein